MNNYFNHAERGLSMIELLIALAISSLLILDITQIYVDNKGNYLFQQGQSDNVENARYTLLILEEELQRVGYRNRPDDSFENTFRAATAGTCTFAAGEVINFHAASQRLCIRYQPNVPGVASCDGTELDAADEPYTNPAEPAIVRLQVVDGALLCNGVAIVDNLVDFKLEFGVSGGESREAARYTLAPAAGETIRSVRYSALLKSRAQNLADSNASPAYQRWQATWYDNGQATAPDRALYLIAESTVNLRNLTR
jgi:type IV pilus assembly protein PilW